MLMLTTLMKSWPCDFRVEGKVLILGSRSQMGSRDPLWTQPYKVGLVLKEALFFLVDLTSLHYPDSLLQMLFWPWCFPLPQAMWSIHLANQHFSTFSIALFCKCQFQIPFNLKLRGSMTHAVERWLCVLLREWNTDYPKRRGYFVFIVTYIIVFFSPFYATVN